MAEFTVLVVEDETNLLEALRYNLSRERYRVVTAGDGEEAPAVARRESPDLVLLDIMLPKLDGLEVCRLLRQVSTVPILMLTAKVEEIDKVLGLEIGADDYMTKPFSMRELLARIKALLRRAGAAREIQAASPGAGARVVAGDLIVDIDSHQALINGVPLELKRKEFDLLAFLVANRGRAFTRDQLLDQVWGYDYAGETRTVDVHVRWLREKIEQEPASPHRIITIRGVGYRFVE